MQQFTISRPEAGYLKVTFDHPPRNFLDATTIDELGHLVDDLYADPLLTVCVFESVNPNFFMARYDLSATPASPGSPWAGLTAFARLSAALAAAPVVSIASIRGRARGGGNEIALACDMRFASRENALLGQPEVPSGILPAGGGIERLALLVGRSRAIEIVISGNDYDADTAERYGWINRALPDADLDHFVDALARRIASFEKTSVVTAKRLLSRHGLPAPDEVQETIDAVPAVAVNTTPRRAMLRARAASIGDDFELSLGRYLGPSVDEERHTETQ